MRSALCVTAPQPPVSIQLDVHGTSGVPPRRGALQPERQSTRTWQGSPQMGAMEHPGDESEANMDCVGRMEEAAYEWAME